MLIDLSIVIVTCTFVNGARFDKNIAMVSHRQLSKLRPTILSHNRDRTGRHTIDRLRIVMRYFVAKEVGYVHKVYILGHWLESG